MTRTPSPVSSAYPGAPFQKGGEYGLSSAQVIVVILCALCIFTFRNPIY
jgi:hypothetical protein